MVEKILLYKLEVEKKDGTKAIFSIYKDGGGIWIVSDDGYEHLFHPSASTIKSEVHTVFQAKVIRSIMPESS